jgi:hypothetical protein
MFVSKIGLAETLILLNLLGFCQINKNTYDLSVIFDQWPKLHLGLDALIKKS